MFFTIKIIQRELIMTITIQAIITRQLYQLLYINTPINTVTAHTELIITNTIIPLVLISQEQKFKDKIIDIFQAIFTNSQQKHLLNKRQGNSRTQANKNGKTKSQLPIFLHDKREISYETKSG
ncbi:hypothetical protein TTHERM_000310008 (macronuclear) [Tetrahymena thermophila SB210]|uniref:Uncharacterized protein n=1 Tax=Tetrahymena thermophila (strain SB210) TaxID=312017 RepID=W7X9R1_TETTS|nr:hypothetical protein TTHERM_000310008 [Tetrahymena thermophila SB210]EWS73138.1 hypothetical protein TTHERM_000310008 [Tetrahymena thermophila SB210]|eukprot:XP_012654325.1 hypothetical protein TTHERM_000310008 [Tetrahymena thermophila SB210]